MTERISIVDTIPTDRLRSKLGDAENYKSASLWSEMATSAAVRLLRERAAAHETLGEAIKAEALLAAATALDKRREEFDVEYQNRARECAEIEKRIEKENPL